MTEVKSSKERVRTPFSTVLVANRGEIALRIMRTARAQGYRTVAVYSEADAGSRHVRAADAAVCIGEASPRKSYLDIGRIVEAARRTGADAVHPGYGFLSENADFAEACKQVGLVFIGPSADSIRRMGDKAAAKEAMHAAGVPCVPGYQGETQTDERLAAEADRIGYPIMIKAVAGGGGRGMRLVEQREAFAGLLGSARSEAQGSFGDSRVLLERAVMRPRHIEIQVFGDRYSNAIHLGERDCSIQRRHQKVIEEAPSPFVTADLRERMGAAAVAAVREIGYEGAGTLEFLVDEDGQFYFMEMNTRLQVEHPVTEAITGLDLVAMQLRIAAGEPIGISQEDVRFSGHAIEVRLCAEDPRRNFMPQSGKASLWRMPANLRVEDALESGATVSPYYDSMIAKIVSHGETRDDARRQLVAGLGDAAVLGIRTNRSFLVATLAHPVFAAGAATTAFVADHGDELLAASADPHKAAAVAAILLRVTTGMPGGSFKAHPLGHSFPVPMRFTVDGKTVEAEAAFERNGSFAVSIGKETTSIRIETLGDRDARLQIGDVTGRAAFIRQGNTLLLHWDGNEHSVEDLTYVAEEMAGAVEGDGVLRASMTGQVIVVHAGIGDEIAPGQPLVTLEAMKMEHLQSLRLGGKVREVLVSQGDQVSAGQALIRVEV